MKTDLTLFGFLLLELHISFVKFSQFWNYVLFGKKLILALLVTAVDILFNDFQLIQKKWTSKKFRIIKLYSN